jgi:hypothetical protein
MSDPDKEKIMASRNFFAELKRRNVYKVAVAYAVVGWLLVQIATQVFPFLEIPNWVVRLIVLLLILGFPIAVILAWAFELTLEGIKQMQDADLVSHSGQILTTQRRPNPTINPNKLKSCSAGECRSRS